MLSVTMSMAQMHNETRYLYESRDISVKLDKEEIGYQDIVGPVHGSTAQVGIEFARDRNQYHG